MFFGGHGESWEGEMGVKSRESRPTWMAGFGLGQQEMLHKSPGLHLGLSSFSDLLRIHELFCLLGSQFPVLITSPSVSSLYLTCSTLSGLLLVLKYTLHFLNNHISCA